MKRLVLPATTAGEGCAEPTDFGRALLERMRCGSIPGLRIPSSGILREDELSPDSDACRFDVEWHLDRNRPCRVDIFVRHRSDPAILADWLARNVDRVNSETDSELDDYARPGVDYACLSRFAENWSAQAGAEFVDWVARCLAAFFEVPAVQPAP